MSIPSTHPGFASYVDPERKVGSQSESPGIAIADGSVAVTGYQSFNIVSGHVDLNGIGQKYKTIFGYFNANRRLFGPGNSLLDIGCSSGLLCFLAKESGFDSVTGVDHDPEYVSILKSAAVASGLEVNAIVGDWKSAPDTYDVVTVLALVHWIFSLTASEGSFESIFRYLAEKTGHFLLIEWVDPTDPAIGLLRHTSANPEVQKEPYDLAHFIAAGERHFGSIDAEITTLPTRRIFVFRKETRIYGYFSVIHFTKTAVIKSFEDQIVAHESVLIDREKKALSILAGVPGIPMILSCTDREISMTNSGLPISPENIPEDAEAQGRSLVASMRERGVRHNDIHHDNLLVKDGKLHLIDFAWASFGSEEADFLPREIGVAYGVRTPDDPFDDQTMLGRTLQIVRESNGNATATPVANTLVFCTAYTAPHLDINNTWNKRYRIWVDAVKTSGLHWKQILLIDDASESLPEWEDTTVIHEGEELHSDSGVVLFTFKTHLGRGTVSDFPGWVRSFFFAARYAEANGFDKVIHLESDAFLISPQICDYFNRTSNGWIALWCPRYQRPESGTQVIAGDAMATYTEWSKRHFEDFKGLVIEETLPFTHIEHRFIGDRYREYLSAIPRNADWTTQTNMPTGASPEEFYWWLRESPESTQSAAGAHELLAIDFASGGNSASVVREGWSVPEPTGTWSIGPESRLLIPVAANYKNCRISFGGYACTVEGAVPNQRLSFLVDFKAVYSETVNGVMTADFSLPNDLHVGHEIDIRIIHPDAVAPHALGIGLDVRPLAFCFSWLALVGEEVAPIGTRDSPHIPKRVDAPEQASNAPGPT